MQLPVYLTCAHCGEIFAYPAKEYTRQSKLGRQDDDYGCSRSCSMLKRRGRGDITVDRKVVGVPQFGNQYGRKYPKDDAAYTEVMRRIKNRSASRRQMEYDIDVEYLKKLWIEQDGICAITRVPIHLEGNRSPFKASLDRKDSNIGYMRGNVQFVAFSVNLAKSTFTDQEILDFFEQAVDSLSKEC